MIMCFPFALPPRKRRAPLIRRHLLKIPRHQYPRKLELSLRKAPLIRRHLLKIPRQQMPRKRELLREAPLIRRHLLKIPRQKLPRKRELLCAQRMSVCPHHAMEAMGRSSAFLTMPFILIWIAVITSPTFASQAAMWMTLCQWERYVVIVQPTP